MHPVERGELEAFRDLFAAAPSELGAQVAELGGALCLRLDTAPATGEFNRAIGLGLGRAATEEGLDSVVGFLNGTASLLAIAPAAAPPELEEWLGARGFARGYGWTKFSRGVADPPLPRTELRVERDGDGAAFAQAVIRGYGIPDAFAPWLQDLARRERWHCFVAFDGDTPAGAAALYAAGDVGWLGVAATVPEHRGKGAQSAILAARIEAAAAAGCSVVVTETGEPVDGQPGASYRNILRAGFEPQYVRANYVPSAAS
jgi:GNAT superfamily N-acetyltransferase